MTYQKHDTKQYCLDIGGNSSSIADLFFSAYLLSLIYYN